MSQIQSKEILIKYKNNVIAKANSFSLEVNKEEIDVTTLDSGGWKRIIGGMKSWSASTDALVTRGTVVGETNYHALMLELFNSDTPAEIIITTATAGDYYYKGNALITGLSESGSTGEVLTYSISFSGDGALTQATVV